MCLRKRWHVTHFETRDNQVLCSCWSPFTEFNRLISLSESCSFDGALTESKRAGSHPSSMPRAVFSVHVARLAHIVVALTLWVIGHLILRFRQRFRPACWVLDVGQFKRSPFRGHWTPRRTERRSLPVNNAVSNNGVARCPQASTKDLSRVSPSISSPPSVTVKLPGLILLGFVSPSPG